MNSHSQHTAGTQPATLTSCGEKMKSLISNFITNTENKSKFEAQDFPGEEGDSGKDLVYTERLFRVLD